MGKYSLFTEITVYQTFYVVHLNRIPFFSCQTFCLLTHAAECVVVFEVSVLTGKH